MEKQYRDNVAKVLDIMGYEKPLYRDKRKYGWSIKWYGSDSPVLAVRNEEEAEDLEQKVMECTGVKVKCVRHNDWRWKRYEDQFPDEKVYTKLYIYA